jgi:3',5'-nucleoside bisphosphate phosphatase
LIDLHSHTTESDGTTPPEELVQLALGAGVEALAITDHDTFAGYEQAAPVAALAGLDLICGIELSTKRNSRTVHVLAYFLGPPPTPAFRAWIEAMLASRRERNRRLVHNLNEAGVDISLGEVEQMGRRLTGRPHFARLLVRKGYVGSVEEAFHRYLGEEAPSFVERDSPDIEEAFEAIAEGGGISVIAHPVRLGIRDHGREEEFIRRLASAGMRGIEVWHSDQTASDSERYLQYARKHNLIPTGGTDFHGGNKPGLLLGTGRNNNVSIPRSVLDNMRAIAPQHRGCADPITG